MCWTVLGGCSKFWFHLLVISLKICLSLIDWFCGWCWNWYWMMPSGTGSYFNVSWNYSGMCGRCCYSKVGPVPPYHTIWCSNVVWSGAGVVDDSTIYPWSVVLIWWWFYVDVVTWSQHGQVWGCFFVVIEFCNLALGCHSFLDCHRNQDLWF